MKGPERSIGSPRLATVRLFDRATGIDACDDALRADLLDTAMLRPLGFVTASIGFLMMSAIALWTVRAPWTLLWLACDVALLGIRLVPAIRPWREGRRVSAGTARIVLSAASAMFVVFSIGCAASFATGIQELRIAAAIAVMGLLTGLATRWAGLPRLAVAMILIVSLPITVVVASAYPLAAVLFAVLAAGTAVLTLQNNRTLVAMLRAEREARRLAVTDPLTGLLNRAGFDAALEQHCGRGVTLVCLDLDGFKLVNDRHGHAAGDVVLVEIGRRLRTACGEAPVARLGGDEFVAIMAGDHPLTALSASAALRASIEQPIVVAGGRTQVRVGASCGSAFGRFVSGEGGKLLAEADRALYEAKRGKPCRTWREHLVPARSA